MSNSVEKLGVRLISVLTLLLTLTVGIAGVVIYKSSDDNVKKRVDGYANEAANIVNVEISKVGFEEDDEDSLENVKSALLGLQARVSGSMWIINQEGEMIVSLNPSYRVKEKFGDTGVTVLGVDNVHIQTLDRKTMRSSLTLKEIFKEGYKSGFGAYDPMGLGSNVVAFHLLKDKNWLIGVDLPSNAAYSEVDNLKINIFKLCILIFIVTIVFTSIAVKKIVKPYYKEQEHLRKNVEINNDKLRQLYGLNNAMQQKLSSGDKFNLISKNILEHLQIDRMNLFLLSKDKSFLECETFKEDISGQKVTLAIPISKDGGVIAKGFKEKNVIAYDASEEKLPADYAISEELMQGADLLTGVFVLLPLIVQNKCIGVAIADNHLSKRKITKETVDFLEIVVNQAAVALENIELYQKLKKYAEELETTDHLTQVYNFSYFKELLEENIARSADKKFQFSLGIVYISNFSVYNEKNGHKAGDMALKRIASIIAESVKEGDTVGRCYGAEFGVIFKGKDEKTALNELRAVVNNIQGAKLKGIETLTEGAFVFKLAAHSYHSEEALTCDEFFKKVEDMV